MMAAILLTKEAVWKREQATSEREQTPTFQRAGGVVQLQGPCVSCFWQQMHEAEGASKRSRRCESLSVCEYVVYVWVCSSATARHETLWGD